MFHAVILIWVLYYPGVLVFRIFHIRVRSQPKWSSWRAATDHICEKRLPPMWSSNGLKWSGWMCFNSTKYIPFNWFWECEREFAFSGLPKLSVVTRQIVIVPNYATNLTIRRWILLDRAPLFQTLEIKACIINFFFVKQKILKLLFGGHRIKSIFRTPIKWPQKHEVYVLSPSLTILY